MVARIHSRCNQVRAVNLLSGLQTAGLRHQEKPGVSRPCGLWSDAWSRLVRGRARHNGKVSPTSCSESVQSRHGREQGRHQQAGEQEAPEVIGAELKFKPVGGPAQRGNHDAGGCQSPCRLQADVAWRPGDHCQLPRQIDAFQDFVGGGVRIRPCCPFLSRSVPATEAAGDQPVVFHDERSMIGSPPILKPVLPTKIRHSRLHGNDSCTCRNRQRDSFNVTSGLAADRTQAFAPRSRLAFSALGPSRFMNTARIH